MTLRSIVAAIAGLMMWWVLFFVIGVGIGLLWPEYREAARVMFQERSFHLFTLPMLLTNWLLFAVAGLIVGRVSTLIVPLVIAGSVWLGSRISRVASR